MSIMRVVKTDKHPAKRRKLDHESSDDITHLDSNDASADENEDANHVPNENYSEDESVSESSNDEKVPGSKYSTLQNPRGQHVEKLKAPPTIMNGTVSSSNNMLQFQAQQLLSEVKPDYDRLIKRCQSLMDKLINVIKKIQPVEAMSLTQAQSYSQKHLNVTIPWSSHPKPDIKYTFSYLPPSRIVADGPVVQRLSTKGYSRIVIVPEMPAEMFQDKDYLNNRAVHKRAFYLGCLASAIQSEIGKVAKVQFANLDNNNLIPILRIVFEANERHILYEVCPSFPPSLGPVQKMTPSQNCLRKDELARESTGEKSSSAVYNSSIRWLSTFTSRTHLLESISRRADNYHDACILGAVWLRQRGFSSERSHGGFGLEEWSSLCALLLESGGHQGRPLFSPRYSAIQLFKAILQVLSTRNMYDPFVLRGEIIVEATDHPIIFDVLTGVNILYKMTPWSYEKLKHYARQSLAVVNSKLVNGFDSAFISRVADPMLEFDQTYTIDFTADPEDKSHFMIRVYEVLKKALSDRISLIDLQSGFQTTWKTTESMPSDSVSRLTLKLLANSDNSNRLVDHGPSVEDKDASKEFRDFWGEKAELRRFKDGRIEESLVWSTASPTVEQIVRYILQRHFRLSPKSITASANLEKLQLSNSMSSEESFAAVDSKFQSLSSTLHHLDGLPLPVRSVTAASELSRSSSLNLPLEPGLFQPIDVLIQFDSSGRWPDDLRAIQYTKIAFLTKIGDLLSKQDRTLECKVGVENTTSSTLGTLNTSFLDIINPSPVPRLAPIVFRLRIHHDREIHLIEQTLSSKSNLPPPAKETHQMALQSQRRDLARASHTTTIRTLITAFPPLSTTIRLLKRFFSTHHLSSHIPPEVIEILAAHTFLSNSSPWSTPGTATTAFARTLYLLSRWDWSTEPLLVDLSLNQDMLPLTQRQSLETRFTAWRKLDPTMNSVAWFIGTNLDSTGVVWTQGTARQDAAPPRVIAGRVTALVTAAVNVMQRAEIHDEAKTIMTNEDWAAVFTSSLADFDFVIHLKMSKASNHKHKNGDRMLAEHDQGTKFKNLEIASTLAMAHSVDATGANTMTAYLEELQRCFGSVALFCHGEDDSPVIGGLWRPHLRSADMRPWKIRLGFSTVPVYTSVHAKIEKKDDDKKGEVDGVCTVNFEGMLAEMEMLGDGIVEKISVNSPNQSRNG